MWEIVLAEICEAIGSVMKLGCKPSDHGKFYGEKWTN